jgi:hypothetical protein
LTTGGSKCDAASFALKKLNLQRLLQRVDAVTERPGRQVEFHCSLFEGAATRSRFEQAQAAQRW